MACELLSSAVDQELVLAEMLYTGAFSQLQAEETAALLSYFVLEERAPPTAQLPENLKKHLNIMQVGVCLCCVPLPSALDKESVMKKEEFAIPHF